MVTVVEPDADELAWVGDRRQQVRTRYLQPPFGRCALDDLTGQVQEFVTAAKQLQHVRGQPRIGRIQVDRPHRRWVGCALDPAGPDLSVAGEADQVHPVLLVIVARP